MGDGGVISFVCDNRVAVLVGLTVLALVILLLFGVIHNENKDWNELRSSYDTLQARISVYKASSDPAVRDCATDMQTEFRAYLYKLKEFPRWRSALVVALIICWFGFMSALCQPRPYVVALVILLSSFLFIWGLVGFLFYHSVYTF